MQYRPLVTRIVMNRDVGDSVVNDSVACGKLGGY